MKEFPHNSAGRGNDDGAAYTSWYGWLEARRFATGLGKHLHQKGFDFESAFELNFCALQYWLKLLCVWG